MFVRNHTGRLVNIDETKFTNDKELYAQLWLTLYDVRIEKPSFNERLIKYISGQTLLV
jgi:hypothetical protein